MFIKRNIINLFDLEYYLYSCMKLLATLFVASMETLYRSLKFRTRVNFFTTQEQPSGSACDQKVDGIKT